MNGNGTEETNSAHTDGHRQSYAYSKGITAEQLALGLKGGRSGKGWTAHCPCHDDRKPSLSINEAEDGKILVHCFAGCGQEAVIRTLREMGLWPTAKKQDGDNFENDQAEKWKTLWDISLDPNTADENPVKKYLKNRGLQDTFIPSSIRHLPASTNYPYPSLIAKIENSIGDFVGLLLIKIDQEGNKAPVPDQKITLGNVLVNHGYICLGQIENVEEILCGEGLENSLCVFQVTAKSTLSLISKKGMADGILPKHVKRIGICADNDRDGGGQQAAQNLALRLEADGVQSSIHIPPGPIPPGKSKIDWLNVSNEVGPSAVTDQLKGGSTINVGPHQMPDHDWPAPLAEEAYYGTAGEIVKTIEPHTEADPAALLFQIITAFGNMIGRSAHYKVEADFHYTNLFLTLVGNTSKARKGLSSRLALYTLKSVDQKWAESCVDSGLSSGEGLIWRVRDEITKMEKVGKSGEYEEVVVDKGVEDKRLLVIEEEFASVLKVMTREGNTLSTIVRDAWTKDYLSTLVKTSRAKATNAHISTIAHITRDELLRNLGKTECANGFGNRFLWACVRRSKLLPDGGQLSQVNFGPILKKLTAAVSFAKSIHEIKRDNSAKEIWHAVYGKLSSEKPGLYGALVARAEAQVTRLSIITALLDRSNVIRAEHLAAALAQWEYCERSCKWIFGDFLGDPLADEILQALRNSPNGLSRTHIRDLFNRNKKGEQIERALAALLSNGLAYFKSEKGSGSRSVELWFAVAPK